MTVSPEWPHVSSYASFESDEHLYLKNLAANWLMRKGFQADGIEHEHYVTVGTGGGRTDLYAQTSGVEAYVECEYGQYSLSSGGSTPHSEGKTVFVFRYCNHSENGVFRTVDETVTVKPSGAAVSLTDPFERTVIGLERVQDLPEPPTGIKAPLGD